MEERTCLNTLPCACKNVNCPRHGRCCECVAFHRDQKHGYPNCIKMMFEAEAAKENA